MKKVVVIGGPKYLTLYSTLMIILLAFFIILNTFMEDMEGGMKDGLGDVKDAFGSLGGRGLMQYQIFKSGRKNVNNIENGDAANPNKAYQARMLEGAGGAGNTDQKLKKKKTPKFLRIEIPVKFEEMSIVINDEMADYLTMVGTAFALFRYDFTIRSYSKDLDSDGENINLASKRAFVIMRFLNKNTGIPFSQMNAVGYASNTFLKVKKPKKDFYKQKQLNYFYVFFGKSV